MRDEIRVKQEGQSHISFITASFLRRAPDSAFPIGGGCFRSVLETNPTQPANIPVTTRKRQRQISKTRDGDRRDETSRKDNR